MSAMFSSPTRHILATFTTLLIGLLIQVVVALRHGGPLALATVLVTLPCFAAWVILLPAFRPRLVKPPHESVALSSDFTAGRTALLPGCFDPPHEGHLALLALLLRLVLKYSPRRGDEMEQNIQ